MTLLELIPSTELAKYLNQTEIGGLSLMSKKLHQIYQPILKKIKAYITTKARCLKIRYVKKGLEAVVVNYSLIEMKRSKVVDILPMQKYRRSPIRNKYNEFQEIAEEVRRLVSLNEGDIVKVIKNSKVSEDDVIGGDERERGFFIFLDGKISWEYQNTYMGLIFSIPLKTYSIYHWAWLISAIIFVIPPQLKIYPYYDDNKLKYIELQIQSSEVDKFRFRINCVEGESVEELSLFVDFGEAKYSLCPPIYKR